MAALTRPTFASYVINEKVTIDTTDREDHTFCGIAFPIQCKTILPVDHLVINSISVRGDLGPLTVWVTKENEIGDADTTNNTATNRRQSVRYNLRNRGETVKKGEIIMRERYWDKLYERKHKSSRRQYCKLDLGTNPIILKPGEIRGIYIHSTLESDQAIVYDNRQKLKTHDDNFLTVLPGRSHVSTEPFGYMPIWGHGNSWRDNREFVGRINYGVVYKLFNPSEYLKFGSNFRSLSRVLFMCQRRWESTFSMLSDDCIFYILNMCRWDWMEDTFEDLRAHKRKIKTIEAQRVLDATSANNEDNQDEEMVEDERNSIGEDAEMEDDGEDQQEAGIEVNVEEDAESSSSYDPDYADSDDSEEGTDSDDGYGDHRGSSIFQYFYYDDTRSAEEEREAEAHNQREEHRRTLWLRAHFGHHFGFVSNYNEEEDTD